MLRITIALVVGLTASGCATKYQDMGLSGGVAAEQMTADTFRISARGNGYTNQTTVQDYIILKAAETTRRAGGTHFMVISSGDASSTGYVSTPGQAHTSIIGNTALTTYSPGMVHQYIKPGQDAYIRVLTLPPGSHPPPGAILADEVIQFVGSRVVRG